MKKFEKTADLWRSIVRQANTTTKTIDKAVSKPVESFGIRQVGILISRRVAVPTIDEDELAGLCDNDLPEIITRHIESEYLDDAVQGYFRFGTTGGYRANEEKVVGRFGDVSEGRMHQIFNTPTGYHSSINIGGGRLSNNFASPSMDQVVYEERVNDFCSCSTIGEFEKNRATIFKAKGNPKLGAFVSYDLSRLSTALKSVVFNEIKTQGLGLVSRRVEYGWKDVKWDIPEKFVYESLASEIEKWLSISFIKPLSFQHEEELRILLVNRNKLGQMDETTRPLELRNKLIADAIVDYGRF